MWGVAHLNNPRQCLTRRLPAKTLSYLDFGCFTLADARPAARPRPDDRRERADKTPPSPRTFGTFRFSPAEGPVPSRAEGPALSQVEGTAGRLARCPLSLAAFRARLVPTHP